MNSFALGLCIGYGLVVVLAAIAYWYTDIRDE